MAKTIEHIDCIHRESWVNLGLWGCSLGKDLTKCAECPHKESRDVECEVTSASTD